ncbi:MAG: peptidoglycan-binding domain-containing protein [Gemmatirosa sp.]
MTVAEGFVDVLRIGEGAAEGGVMGIRSCGPAYDVYQRRRNGQPIGRRPAQAVERGAALAPRPSTLAGVQFRLNALGFGAGPEDGVPGPRTTRAERALRQSYPPLVADGVPGPTTQAKLVEVCACRATGVGGGAVTQKARHDRSRCRA